MQIIRTEEEIEKVYAQAIKSEETGQTKFTGMTFEQGVIAMYDWLTRPSSENPFED